MDPQQWEKVKDLFELGEPMTPAEREDLLAKEPDDVVRKEAARLLKINPLHAFIDQPVMSPEYLDRFTGHAALLSEGEMLGTRYKIEKRIASGGMGDVYSAYDKDLRERIAIKTIRQDIISNPAIVSRFRREISLARRVAHPNVCKVYDLSQEKRSSDGRTVDFLTMELVEGETLSQWLKREAPVGFEVARPLLEQICAGLAAAHDAGVVHRDFKGSNVLIVRKPDGSLRAAVTDFGLARSVSPDTGASHESSTGLAGGTPAYMAPEQMEGRTVGPKADLYALGIVMYEMATGTAPHTGDSPLQIAVRRVTEKPQAPRIVNPDIDASWEEAILRCLEYKPEDRPADARAVAQLFGKDRPLFTVPRWRMPRWLLPALAGAAAVMVGVWWWTNRPPEHSEEAMRWYRRGTDLLMDGSYASARAAFERSLEFEKDFGLARARLADVNQDLDLLDDANREIALATSRDAGENQLIEGIRFSVKGNLPEAIKSMEAVAKRSPSSNTLLDYARVLERADRLDEAITAFQEVLKRDSDNPGALIRLVGILQLKGGKPEEVERHLDKAEAAYSLARNLEGKAAVLLIRAMLPRSKPAQAEEMVRNAGKIAKEAQSTTLEIRARLAEALLVMRRGDPDLGLRLATETTQLAAKTGQMASVADGIAALAEVQYLAPNYDKAAVTYREALDLALKHRLPRTAAKIKQKLGDTMTRNRQVAEGVALLEEARSYFAVNGFAVEALRCRQIIADAYGFMASDPERAIGLLRTLLKEASEMPAASSLATRVRASLGKLLYQTGWYPEAAQLLTEVVSVYSAEGNIAKLQYTQIDLARVLASLGENEKAQAVVDRILAAPLARSVAPAKAVQVLIFRARGENRKALELLRALGSENGANSWVKGFIEAELCSVLAEEGPFPEAEVRCQSLVPKTSTEDTSYGDLATALTELHLSQKNWSGAITWATKLRVWSDAHHDPEHKLLAPLLMAAAFSGAAKEKERIGQAAVFADRKAMLERSWGSEAVARMLRQSAFSRHIPTVK